jgi:Lamin Tail Domain
MLRTNVILSLVAVPFAVACSPETDLDGQQTTKPAVSKSGSDTALSPTLDPLAGVLVEPPPGSVDIPTNVASLVVRFAEAVQPTGTALPFQLRPATGDALAVTLGPIVGCDGICYRLLPAAVLAPSTSYTLEAADGALQFLDGKPTPAGSAGSFTTANAADVFAPRVLSFTVSLAEGCLSAHVAADEAVRVEITVAAGDGQAVLSRDGFASAADFGSRLPDLPTDVSGQATLRIFDRAGNNSASAPAALQLPPPLPALAITEVLANPAGSETTQEFVEIYNRGSDTQDLGGLLLADKSGSDVLPQGSLAAGAYAVIVPEGFAADGKDPAPRDGTLVVRVAGRLGGDGLSNAGEVVRLLTAQGDVISQYGGWVDVSATAWSGRSVKRSSPDACDAADAWSKSPSAPTPGW